MSSFSASDAALEGFEVLRRHWRVIVGWAGFNVLATVCMVVVTVVVAVVAAALMGGRSDVSELSARLGGLVAVIGAVLIGAVLMGGLYRLTIRPEQPAFLHLRLGRDEIRLVGLMVILLLGVGFIGGLIAGLTGVLAETLSAMSPALSAAAIVVGFVIAIWLLLRLSLTGPATFAEGRLAFRSSWRLTRGHVPALLGMLMITGCVAAIMSIASWLMIFLIVGLTTGFGGLVDVISGREDSAPGVYILQIAAQLVSAPVIWVIWGTPAISVYQKLTAPADLQP